MPELLHRRSPRFHFALAYHLPDLRFDVIIAASPWNWYSHPGSSSSVVPLELLPTSRVQKQPTCDLRPTQKIYAGTARPDSGANLYPVCGLGSGSESERTYQEGTLSLSFSLPLPQNMVTGWKWSGFCVPIKIH